MNNVNNLHELVIIIDVNKYEYYRKTIKNTLGSYLQILEREIL